MAPDTRQQRRAVTTRNLLGFWFLGLCNNFAFAVMLSAAEDIISRNNATNNSTASADQCEEKITRRNCDAMSTGSILMVDILPTFFVKLTFPFFAHRIAYGVRHLVVVLLQAASFLTVAFSPKLALSLFGVVLASLSSGLGEITYLALSSHFSRNSIAAFAAGTGAAGIFSALAYAVLTEPHLLGWSPQTTLIIMLIVPVLFTVVYWALMVMPNSVHRVTIADPQSLLVSRFNDDAKHVDERHALRQNTNLEEDEQDGTGTPASPMNCERRFRLIVPLLRYMLPLFAVYYAEYIFNQGISQSIVFPCSEGWGLSPASQYRWYQVCYNIGVLISRSSIFLFQIPPVFLPVLALLQLCNAGLGLTEAIFSFIPHIAIVFAVILYEGLLGGATYANAFHSIHETISAENREFSLSVASVADSSGIVAAALSSIPVHNFICRQPIH